MVSSVYKLLEHPSLNSCEIVAICPAICRLFYCYYTVGVKSVNSFYGQNLIQSDISPCGE